ncbi:MAG: DNA topoisomerase [Nanoarchaeota archaeon]|nr:DNA topoisomerase [Nanoarchaeota archaeon]
MAVEAFLKPSESKRTIEKTVRPKPKLSDLITIESPGRPSPANLLDDKDSETPKKARSSRKNPVKAEPKVVRKGNAVLIITEKPQAAQKIASALGDFRKYSEEGVSYYEVNKEGRTVYVASAVGHLFGLTYKKGQKGWPIFELEWQPSFNKKGAAFTRKYYNLLKKLASKSSGFIIATDFDIEGEVIGWNVLRFICKQTTAKRMKFSTLTAPELKKAFENPMAELAWGNAYAGETRHILDWLYGINLSRALMSAIKKTGSFRLLSIGRVQGPALKIIVDREREIQKFKPVPYWQVFASAQNLEFKHPRDIFNKNNLEIFKTIKEALAETKKSEEKIQPPHPFDLTTLQREAYRFYKINPSETLSIAQKLYLDGIISYPRTSSQKIPEAIEPKKIIKSLLKHFPEAKFCTRDKPIEGKKSDPAHPSIYPTGEYKELAEREGKIYTLIVKRFLSAFAQDAITANKRIVLTALDKKGSPLKTIITEEVDNENSSEDEEEKANEKEVKQKEYTLTFTTSAQALIEKGWMQIYPHKIEESELPDINGKVKIEKIRFEEKETQPPNRYTPASLVSILEKKNLGTKSTRSMIVETLFDRGYLDGQSIKATPLGIRLIESLEKYSSIIIDENLTRKLENEMEQIQNSSGKEVNLEGKEKEIIDAAKKIIMDISKEFKVNELKIGQELLKGLEILRAEQQESNTLMPCPTCKKGNLRIMYSKKSRRYFVACSAYPECTQTYSLPPNALIKKSEKICEADNFPKLLAIRKAKRPWEFCFNPNCPIEKAKREKWEASKSEKDSDNQD